MAKKLVCIIGSLSVSAAVISPMVNRPTSQKYTCSKNEIKELNISKAIGQARKLIFRVKNEVGAPGIIIGVSVDGKVVWKEGIGYADLENEVEAHDETVMRIASISKSLTAAVVGRLWQEGVIDIDKPIQKYVPTFPEKFYENEKVVITTRQLMCHLSGIRHYSKKKKDDSVAAGDGQLEEFYSKERYENVEKALSIFKDDDLLHSPGSKFLYTTYGWTVVSAVMEGATGKTYPQLMRAFLREIGMRRTYLDEPEPIIYGRSKCYSRNKKGRIVNSPYVDNSCKWAGGGFLSTVGDLLKFANAMLYAFQSDGDIDISKVSSRVQTSTIEEKAEVVEQKQSAVKESSLKITDRETGEKIEESKASQVESEPNAHSGASSVAKGIREGGSSVLEVATSTLSKEKSESASKKSEVKSGASVQETGEKIEQKGETDSYLRSGVSSIVKGLGEGGSYVWGLTSSMLSKEKSESASKESEVKSGASVQETGEKIEQKGETDSYLRSGVSSIVKGLGEGGSYVWGLTSSMLSKEKSESASKESEVKSGASVQETGEKIEQKGETDSYLRSGVSSIVKGLGEGGSYVWGLTSSMLSKEKSESASKESEVKSGASVQETGEKIEQKGETDSYLRSGVSSIVKGLGEGGSYVWGLTSSMLSKEKSESASKESEVKSGASVQETGEKIKQKDETDSHVRETGKKIEESKVAEVESDSYIRSGASSIMNGIGKGGSYVWGLTSSMLSKERSESSNKESEVKSSASVQETGEKIEQKDETDSHVRETGKKIEESKVAEVESDSYVRSGASSIMNGIGKGGSYVWGLTSSMLSKERSESASKENSVETYSPIKSSLSSMGSTASSVWKKLTFSSDKKDLSSSQKSDSISTEEEKQSLIELLGNWFKPKALDNAEPISRTHWEEDETLSSLSPESEGGIGFWFDVLPYAAGVLLGQMPRKNIENQTDLEELEKFNGVRNPYDSNTMNFSIKNPYVLPGTVAKLWTRVEGTRLSDWGPHVEGGYGLGFGVAQAIDSAGGVPDGGQPYIVGHTGGAVGASSAMVIVPRKCNEEKPPKGVAVVLLTNLQAVSLNPLAIEIARIFANVVT